MGLSPLPISIRYLWFKISVLSISISFTAALFWLTHIFHYRYKIVSDVSIIPKLSFRTSRNVTKCNKPKSGIIHIIVFKLTLKNEKQYDKISISYRYHLSSMRYRYINKLYLKCRYRYDTDRFNMSDVSQYFRYRPTSTGPQLTVDRRSTGIQFKKW